MVNSLALCNRLWQIQLILIIRACSFLVVALIIQRHSFVTRSVIPTFGYNSHSSHASACKTLHSPQRQPSDVTTLKMTGWSDFQALDDEDDDWENDFASPKRNVEYADENDTDSYKRYVGEGMSAPAIEYDAEPIFVDPIDGGIELTTENLLGVLSACREEIKTVFGYQAENRGVGITGSVDYVDRDGPVVILRLKGRFWHERTTVLDRVSNYLQARIPEIVEVTVEDPYQLTQEANEEEY